MSYYCDHNRQNLQSRLRERPETRQRRATRTRCGWRGLENADRICDRPCHFAQDVLWCEKLRARSSVDRASGSGPEGRGFKSLRAHFECLLWSKGFRLIVLPIALFFAQISIPSVPSIPKTASISAKFAQDFLCRAFNWLSRSIASGNSAKAGANFLGGCISILQGRSISADNLLVRIRDLLRKCFAPTNIFPKMRCT